jgi:hypothetical protein
MCVLIYIYLTDKELPKMGTIQRITLVSLLCILALSLSLAQTGSIKGRIIDQITQEPLPSAVVQVMGTQIGASSDTNGQFTISNIPVGTYQVRASLIGYEPHVESDVIVAVARPVELLLGLRQSNIDIEGVEVRAGYFQRTPDAPVSVQQLTYEEIRRSPGGLEDVVRAIAVLPGVAQAQPGRNDLVVRGGAPSENLFLVDNIEIPNINHFGTQGAGGGPLSYINLDFVQETAFSTGGFGVRYGDRMSSVLNIDLRDGRTDRLGGKATVSATQFGLNVEGPLSETGNFVFSARRSYLDFIFKAAGFGFVPEYWDFLGRAHYKLDKQNDLTILAVGAIDDVSFFNDNADRRFSNSRVLGTAQRQYASGVSLKHLFTNGFATFTLGRSFVRYNGIQRDSLLVPVFSNRSEEGETSLRADVTMKAAEHTEISLGAQAKLVRFRTDLALPGYVTPFGDTLSVDVQNYLATGAKGSVYLQLTQNLFQGLSVIVGGRGDYFDRIDQKFVVAPRAAIVYEINPLTTISASAGTFYQSPSYIWLVANSVNRRLYHVRADQFVVGVERMLRDDLRFRIEGYTKLYSNYPASIDRPYLVLANTGGGFGGSEEGFASYGLDPLVSQGKGRSVGVELLLQKKLSDVPLYGQASLTLSNTRFTAIDGVERPGSYDQGVIVNLSAGYRFNEKWEASAKFRYSSGHPYTPFNANGTQNTLVYNSERTVPVHGLDVRVDRRWNFATWTLIGYIDVQNIYSNKHSGSVRWNAREQRVEMDESSIGILPSIGISAEL